MMNLCIAFGLQVKGQEESQQKACQSVTTHSKIYPVEKPFTFILMNTKDNISSIIRPIMHKKNYLLHKLEYKTE